MSDPSVAKDTKIQLRSGVPTFLVADVASTARWYEAQLGFQIAVPFLTKSLTPTPVCSAMSWRSCCCH